MTNLEIAHQRLHNQYLASATCEDPAEVVRWFGAVQAQDYPAALWGVGMRTQHPRSADVEQAMANGTIVRTHPMRGTWHFVAAEDIRWVLALTAPRAIAGVSTYYRQLELDEATFAKCNAVFAKTLQGGKQLTRKELAAALEQAGISTAGLRLTFLVMRAELDGVIASGARRGKQFTYALLEELVPVFKALDRDEALAEWARRYFTSHGPATVQDFAWWSELTVADARAGLEMVKSHFVPEVIDGQTYWLSPSTPTTRVASPAVHLLPVYDEYTVAYKDRSAVLDPAFVELTSSGLGPIIVVNGQIVGVWKRIITKECVVLTPSLFTTLDEAETRALVSEANRYGAFLESAVNVTFQDSGDAILKGDHKGAPVP